MPLRDPVAIYNAANNVDAHFAGEALTAAGIDVHVVEDVSHVGTWIGGILPEVLKPQVFVERADVERAKPVLLEFERRANELRTAGEGTTTAGITVTCEECGMEAIFPESQRGSVQECPNCRAFLDVGDTELPAGWDAPEQDEHAP